MPDTLATNTGTSPTYAPMPKAPDGFVECRVGAMRAGDNRQITHLVLLDSEGSNGGRPTMCRLTRFDTRDPKTGRIMLSADLPGWSMGGGGVMGPRVEQVECPDCWARIGEVTR
ncbi:hypothetical protein G5V59_02645 [Nocardioides sp. W3-2-3]|uniref:hypothetical protein n=1 Tax=Nocardioides convexus TaxID=2712224 RepID=UPI0024187883|nr:hypothetical protein [Nocardioides convexus]NGZ99651.1 hypothetical protein [Nocardioides convexus]